MGKKINKKKLSALILTNAFGDYKRKIIVIGKYKRPHCLKEINLENFLIAFISAPIFWMNTNLFEEFG